MTPANLQRLHDVERAWLRAEHPNVPGHALPSSRYSDKTANGLTRCIIAFLKYSGWQAERIANMGRPVVGKETRGDLVHGYHVAKTVKWLPGGGTNGTADISSTIRGRSVKIEVKIGRDRQSSAQIRYAAAIVRSGGVYMIARDFDTWVEEYDKLMED